jgi:hypothetical protein
MAITTIVDILGTNATYDAQTGIGTFKVTDLGLTNANATPDRILAGIVKKGASRTFSNDNNVEVAYSTKQLIDRGGTSKLRFIHQISTYQSATNIPNEITLTDV